MTISLVAAIGNEREIGIGGDIPWRGQLPEDLKRFKDITSEKPHSVVIMGSKTYKSIGRPLPNRLNVVLTKNTDFQAQPGVLVAGSLQVALGALDPTREIFIIGGAQVFQEGLKIARRMHITFVDINVPNADAYFPQWNPAEWRVAQVLPCPPDERNKINSTYVVYQRR